MLHLHHVFVFVTTLSLRRLSPILGPGLSARCLGGPALIRWRIPRLAVRPHIGLVHRGVRNGGSTHRFCWIGKQHRRGGRCLGCDGKDERQHAPYCGGTWLRATAYWEGVWWTLKHEYFYQLHQRSPPKININKHSESGKSEFSFLVRIKISSLHKAAHDIFTLIWLWNKQHFTKILYQHLLYTALFSAMSYAGPTNLIS